MDIAGFAAVGLYAGLNTLVLLWITMATGRLRGKLKIFIGDGAHPHMIRIMRGHANAIETIPIALILMILMAVYGAPLFVIHIFGVALTLGRVLHAAHFIAADAPGWQRMAGASLSMLVLIVGGLGVLVHGVVLMLQSGLAQ